MTFLPSSMGSALAVDSSELTATALQPDGPPIEVAKSRSGQLAETDPALFGRTDSTPTLVVIKLDYDPVASYAGTISGFTATSPEVTGRPLREGDASVRNYVGEIARIEAAAIAGIRAAVPQAQILRSFRIAYGGLSAIVPANRVEALLGVRGVAAVQQDTLAELTTDTTPDFIGATQAWDQISNSTTAGEGVVVGILDSGIWPEHPSLADNGITYAGPELDCDFGDGSDPDLGAAFECNDKLIGAYTFVDTYLSVYPPLDGEFCNDAADTCTARDANGHGTHTATTAAGSHVEEAVLLGVDQGPISGIAPGAHVVAYRVCLDEGCFQTDSVAAVEQAILDGVDVLNFSISGGANPYTDPVELAFLDAYAAGILVNASAGNAGPGAATSGHAGPWTNTVGASTSNRHFLTDLELTAGGASLTLTGATVTDGIDTPAEVVLAQDVPGYDDSLCQTPLPADSATGMIVACERGVIARVDKSLHVEPSGATGMILYNLNPANGTGLNTDNHFIPTVHIDVAAGEDLLEFLAANPGAEAAWDPGTPTAVPGDVMAGFSSRGPQGDFLKPDVTAPGVQILAGNTPEPVGEGTGLPGQLFQAIQGTSMSSPHAAGVAALVKAAHPDWTPGQIKSALMTSSLQAVKKEDGSTNATPFDRGAGSIRANRAIAPTLTFDVHADDYYASAGDELGRLDLNLPSIYADPMPGAVVTQRTMKNVSGSSRSVTVSASGPGGAISVTPASFVIGAGATQTIRITIDGRNLADGWHFGQVRLDVVGSSNDAVIPVAFNKMQGEVTLDHGCSPSSVTAGTAADCEVTATNLSPVPAQVSLDVKAAANASTQLEVTNIGAPGVKSGNGFVWNGTLSAAEAPEIDSVALVPLGSPAGYLPLSLFGIGPIGGIGDETIVNFNVPSFRYGSETYSRIGYTSNGYAVVGGGESADVDYIPQDLPDPTRPNNVLAPFWTDLDFTKGGEFRVATLTDGVNTWLIGDWTNVSTWDASGTNSFQIWIQLGATEDITFTYGPIGGPDSIGLTVGAENRDGTSGAEYGSEPAEDDELVVSTSPPTPGGAMSIGYDALGKGAGTYDITAVMTTNLMNASTIESAKVSVTSVPGLPFNDIAGSRFLDDILWLHDQGITAGCSTNPPLFCPDGRVTRAQMATFLTRALNLPPASR
ncbi:MAG TPA: S8 family serine peptidase, partial [Candidatus Angelobacter sp.]|nr:S8 family serine peptidase [Candidatus Angelobacter sp.]